MNESNLLSMLGYDIWRIRGRAGVAEFFNQIMGNRAYRVVFSYRLCRYLRSRPFFGAMAFFPLAYFFHRVFTGAICAELPLAVSIGPGFVLQHGYGLVVNKQASIGRDVTLFHEVTIGATAKGVPTIGNRVVVAAKAAVLGPIHVGDEVTIGAASVVIKDVECNTIVAGNPAKVIATGEKARVNFVIDPEPACAEL